MLRACRKDSYGGKNAAEGRTMNAKMEGRKKPGNCLSSTGHRGGTKTSKEEEGLVDAKA